MGPATCRYRTWAMQGMPRPSRCCSEATGSDFDKGYADTQVKEQAAVLQTVEERLLPSAMNDDLKAYLAGFRRK